MKNIVYIGNKWNKNRNANFTSIDLLEPLFTDCGYTVFSASDKKNIFLRMINMLWLCFKQRNKTDYVLIDTYGTLNFYYAYLVSQFCRILKLKYLPILHGGKLPDRLKNFPVMSRAIFKNAHLNIAPSLFTKSNFEASGYTNIICIPNTVKLENYTFKERTFNDIKLLWVRSFSKMYNPLLAIKIIKLLNDKNIKAELCMVGPDSDGSLLDVKNYADELGVVVTFTGKLSKQEWIKRSNHYNIFINTTNVDNMPVSVIESMALGLPVISTNVGGIPFLIEDDKTGILVEPNSVEAFVMAIIRLMNSPDDTRKMVKNAREYAEQFDWKTIKNQWVEVLR
ncbi:hypothetical protein GCM10023311_02420 [Flaviramulus aquimarinus]|uniref:Glycosyl transferase family 1 domain-containing protein n=1 Tax=Flaviramulus aquimarinus TaxID=1170456 RepID=A0ABP9ERP9_9FLAO